MTVMRMKRKPALLLDPATMVVCTEAFRPQAVTRMIERGQWLRLDHPAVRAHPERFAVRLTDLEPRQAA
jgi:hypothetical protein